MAWEVFCFLPSLVGITLQSHALVRWGNIQTVCSAAQTAVRLPESYLKTSFNLTRWSF